MRFQIILLCSVLILSCAVINRIPPATTLFTVSSIDDLIAQYPDSALKLSWVNLQNTSSFVYQYQFKSDRPHNVWATFKGIRVFPNQEQRQGEYTVNDKTRKVMIKARGDYQYQIDEKTKKWRVMPREEDADLMITIERVIANTKFYLIEQDSRFLTYSFHPNLAFLDPTFTSRIKAVFIVDKNTLLPLKISAQDSLEQILWRVEFANYNTRQRIKFPFSPNTQIEIASLRKLAKNETNTITTVLSNRLRFAGENFQIKSKRERNRARFEIAMEIPTSVPDHRLIRQLLTTPGKFYIFAGQESIPLFDESNISDIKITGYEPYPQIELQINQNGAQIIKEYLASREERISFRAVLDATELAIFDIDKDGFSDRIVFRVLFNRNEIMNTIAVIKGGMLSLPLKLVEIRSGR
ncbi:MAG: hypothetical protein KGZ86_02445 [Candidatus Latescibacteria bacterium]|nr:hypothetical protein [Candidatus Latescibacterota bacterium]